jgi:hypothetical protein
MRPRISLLLFVLAFQCSISFSQWDDPVPITTGSRNDSQVALISSGWFWSMPNVEWMAFVREDSMGKNIYLMKSTPLAMSWIDTVYPITQTSSFNEHPALTRQATWVSDTMLLVWHSRTNTTSHIQYSFNTGTGWGQPMQLTSGVENDRNPDVAGSDSGFGAVWERDGGIAFAEARGGVFGSIEQVTSDTGSSSPRIKYIGFSPMRPLVVWEKRKAGDTTHVILFSIRNPAGWTTPDTLVSAGDNRNPRFANLGPSGSISVSWESFRNGRWDILGRFGDYWNGALTWEQPVNLTGTLSGNHISASFTIIPFITGPASNGFWFYGPGTWQVNDASGFRIALSVWFPSFVQYVSAGTNAENRRPVISSGIIDNNNNLRVWSIWEANVTGVWKLYGSTVIINLGDVGDEGGVPLQPTLFQNYPNPFNPSTTFAFSIRYSSLVILKVYDVLGREVATLVNEELNPGTYEVRFDATGLASGVYLYRLTSGRFSQVRKMIVTK